MSYQEYDDLVRHCAADQKTTGNEQTAERIEFTRLNASRIRRLNKTIKLSDRTITAFKGVPGQTWLVLTESWCGDAAQTMPVLNRIAEASPMIDLRIVLAEEHEDLMDAFLTDGARAIPKIIMLDKNEEIIGTWGPRSKAATQLVADHRKRFGSIDAEFKKDLQVWYNKDRGLNIINDLLEIVGTLEAPREA